MAWELSGNQGTNPNTDFLGTTDGQPLVIRTASAERMRLDASGKVGIGVADPQRALSIGSALNVDQANANSGSVNPGITFGSASGEGIASKRTAGGNQYGLDLYTGSAVRLSIANNGYVGIGNPTSQLPQYPLHIKMDWGILGLDTRDVNQHSGIRLIENGAVKWHIFNNGSASGNRLSINSETTGLGISIDQNGNVGVGKDINVAGSLALPKQGGGHAEFTRQETFFADSPGQLKLNFGYQPSGGQAPLYEFTVGHIADTPWGPKSGFARVLSVLGGRSPNEVNVYGKLTVFGNLSVSGSKSGYVVDHFINGAGDTLEQGDVVVISSTDVTHYAGAEDNIPLPDVDLTEKAYDPRICGIVAEVVVQDDLPFVEGQTSNLEDIATAANATEDAVRKAVDLGINILGVEGTGSGGRILAGDVQAVRDGTEEVRRRGGSLERELGPHVHPLAQFAGAITPESEATQVEDQQLGRMVTLGAFAHCKVDADIAPIEAGDLLTTSSTRGHAQKVLEPQRAIGAIVGKALASLREGKGKIPVLVMLH